MNDPQDPVTPLLEAANQQHELYLAYLRAGFSEAQAFSLIQTLVAESCRGQRE